MKGETKMALNSKEAIEILESVVGRVGNDEEIESVTADLIDLKDYLLTVDITIDELNEELAKVNEKNRDLLQSNDTLYRQIGHQIIVNERRNKNGFKLKRSN